MASVKQTEQGSYMTLDPEITKKIMNSVGAQAQKLENLGKNPIVITAPIVRIYFKRLTEDYFKDLIVVSYNLDPAIFQIIRHDFNATNGLT